LSHHRMQTFRLTERPLRPGCHEIQVEGEVDMAVADQFEQALERAASQSDEVLVGLERCEFIDSTIIAVLVRAHNKMAAEGRRVVAYGPSSQVHRVLSVTGLTGNGLVFESLDEALSASPDGDSSHED
jgi:anti-sigma B factor antagonist